LAGALALLGCGQLQSRKAFAEESAPTPAQKAAHARKAKRAAAPVWLTDFEQAKKQAAAKHRVILADFRGSDWCIWCIRLEREVFSKKAFQDFAREHLVLLDLDFPHEKPQPAELKKRNEALAEKFGVEGFPTVILLSPKGEALARTGYRPGGATAYVKHLEGLLKEIEAKAKAETPPSKSKD
jgi:thioredoxin-related protein